MRNGERISVMAIGNYATTFENNKYLLLNNVYFILDFKRNLLSISRLHEQFIFVFDFVSLSRNGVNICSSFVDDGLYFVKPKINEMLQTKLFKVAEPTTKQKKRFLMKMKHTCGIKN